MGQIARTARSQRGVIALDWMLMTVAAIAVLLLIGTMVRISAGDEDTQRVGDLLAMRAGDDLLAFQDFTFGAPGWAPADTSDRLHGIGPVLGPFSTEAVHRAFEIPVNAYAANMVFDLHLLGDWGAQDLLHISLGEIEVLRLQASDVTAATGLVDERDGIRVVVERRSIAPQPSEISLPGSVAPFVSHTIRIGITDPGQTLVLRLSAEAGGDATWALDNLTVVAVVDDRR